jgi:hypothetical protein
VIPAGARAGAFDFEPRSILFWPSDLDQRRWQDLLRSQNLFSD